MAIFPFLSFTAMLPGPPNCSGPVTYNNNNNNYNNNNNNNNNGLY